MAYDYTTYVQAIANETAIAETGTAIADMEPNFVAIVPRMIEYAEQRMYRELDMLATRIRQTVQGAALTRNLPLSTAVAVVVLETLSVITPVGVDADAGQRNPLQPVSRDFLDLCWSSQSTAALPRYYCEVNTANEFSNSVAVLGPVPDNAYTYEVCGTFRPTALSATNTTTILSVYLPDAFFAASMIFMAGWQKNFGAQADDPKMAMSWSAAYDALMASANGEEMRKKLQGAAWTPYVPSPIAAPPRS